LDYSRRRIIVYADIVESGALGFTREDATALRREGQMPEELIGKVSAFFANPVVAGIDLSGTLNAGDTVRVKGHTTDLTFSVASMQVNNVVVVTAGSGVSVGIKVPDRCRPGDEVFRVS
jgi:hypothetical protein